LRDESGATAIEYGRDTFGERAGKSFSEGEWQAWLAEIAKRYRHGLP
jgi:hypothetical protein